MIITMYMYVYIYIYIYIVVDVIFILGSHISNITTIYDYHDYDYCDYEYYQ